MKRREFLRRAAAAGGSLALPPIAQARQEQDPATSRTNAPLIERYSSDCRARSGMALGGIGAGYVELRKNGRFYDWNIFNNFPRETAPRFELPSGELEDRMAANLFFEVRYKIEEQEPRIKLLQLNDSLYEGAEMGIAYSLPWMQAVETIEYSARFPVAELTFTDSEMPFQIKMRAWSSFIPHDVKNSSLPLIFFDFSVIPKTDRPVEVMLLMSARNNAGYESAERHYTTQIAAKQNALIISMGCGGISEKASSWGQIALASLSSQSSYYAGWGHRHPYYEQVLRRNELPNIDDTNGEASLPKPPPAWMPKTIGRNRVDPSTGKLKQHDPDIFSTVAHSFILRQREEQQHTFLYAWSFPNLYNEASFGVQGEKIEGHYYSNFFQSAAGVIDYGQANLTGLRSRTLEFLHNFFDSDAEVSLLEQVNSQLNTFFTSGRLIRNGDFGVLEGLASTHSWGPIATIDVLFYGSAPIIALFPELQQSTMRCHARVQAPSGEINHGLQKDFSRGEDNTAGVRHRIDLPGQFAITVLRDYFWTNDEKYIQDLLPSVERAIDYILKNRSGTDGAMPVTKDIETSYDNFPMSGYASYLLSQWLCALESLAIVKERQGQASAAAHYRSLAAKTRERMEQGLWTGSYYKLFEPVDDPLTDVIEQKGCLTDQLVGQWAAHFSGIGELLPPDRIHLALRTIFERNYRRSFGLKNCSFREDGALSDVPPDIWNDQANTCWSGVELAFASFLIYEGMYSEGVAVAKTVDARYRKNGLYWNHQEFGGHYFRPMSAWSIVNAQLGFSLQCGRLTFDPKLPQRDVRLFFAVPTGTAQYRRQHRRVTVRCLTGSLGANSLRVKSDGVPNILVRGQQEEVSISTKGDWTEVMFRKPLLLQAGEVLTIDAD